MKGHVYILVSPSCEYIKIGGTEYPPLKRIKEINASEPYQSLGPWKLHDFRQVADWRKIETSLHYAFRSKQCKTIVGQRELFDLVPQRASRMLEDIDPAEVIKKPKVDRMFQDEEFSEYMLALFRFAGLTHWLDIQGAWTLSLFPGTSGGRYFTLNIGSHEVAFSTLEKSDRPMTHMILVDSLIKDFKPVKKWLKQHDGGLQDDYYKSALPRATLTYFTGNFADAQAFLQLEGVRRALIAYWSEALIELKERGVLSVNAQHHNWNAVAELYSRINRIK